MKFMWKGYLSLLSGSPGWPEPATSNTSESVALRMPASEALSVTWSVALRPPFGTSPPLGPQLKSPSYVSVLGTLRDR